MEFQPTFTCLSPAPDPPARGQQHDARGGGNDAMLGVNAGEAGLMTGEEARQLVCRQDEIAAGHNKQQQTENNEDDFHGIVLNDGQNRFGSASMNQIHARLLSRHSLENLRKDSMMDVVNNKSQNRYELTVDGHLAATYYKVSDGVITFIHTEVPPELAGQGIGSRLVKGALDQVRADGIKVVAECPFVKAYIEKHGEYADLLKQ
jgi:uncharacterized protein